MGNKTAGDFIHTNSEYEKLKKGGNGRDSAPRETPSGQGPGRGGFDKQLFSEWTRDELASYAKKLGIDVSSIDPTDSTERVRLISAIESRDATRAR